MLKKAPDQRVDLIEEGGAAQGYILAPLGCFVGLICSPALLYAILHIAAWILPPNGEYGKEFEGFGLYLAAIIIAGVVGPLTGILFFLRLPALRRYFQRGREKR